MNNTGRSGKKGSDKKHHQLDLYSTCIYIYICTMIQCEHQQAVNTLICTHTWTYCICTFASQGCHFCQDLLVSSLSSQLTPKTSPFGSGPGGGDAHFQGRRWRQRRRVHHLGRHAVVDSPGDHVASAASFCSEELGSKAPRSLFCSHQSSSKLKSPNSDTFAPSCEALFLVFRS